MTDASHGVRMPASAPAAPRDPATTIKLIIAWLWVGIPAVWGIWHVFQTSLKLFR